jgi:cell division septum initiation protein DivIVA
MVEDKVSKIMTKPLPQILDELEAKEEELQALFDELKKALQESKDATITARKAGEEAAACAEETAKRLISEVRENYDLQLEAIRGRLTEHDSRLYAAGSALQGPPASSKK